MAFGSRFYREIYNKDYFTGRKSFFYKLGYWNSRGVNRKKLAALLRYKRGGKLLDIGCAFGFVMEEFQRDFAVFGLDVSEYAIEHALHDVPRKNMLVHDVEKDLPFPDDYFDAVTCFDVLEHVRRPEIVVRNMRRHLKRGGILFISTPNRNILRRLFFSLFDRMEHHISMMPKKKVERMLARNGFVMEMVRTAMNFGIFQIWLDSRFGLETVVICRKV